ncbi:MAG: hypothetical protein ACR2QF_05760 [Geminicoccaceae bacterium]
MILADDIIAAAGTRLDLKQFGALTRLAIDVHTAERFVLDRQTLGAVMGVSHSSPQSIMSARSFARAPFRKTWIEWRFQDVLDARGMQCRQEPDRYPPIRVGCLLQENPDRPLSGMMTLAWRNQDDVEQSLFCQIYDLGEEDPDLDLVAAHFVQDSRLGYHDDLESLRAELTGDQEGVAETTRAHLNRDRQQVDYLLEGMSRFDFVNNPRTIRLADLIAKESEFSATHFLRDWEREGLTVISSMILMNSRDLAVRVPVSQVKLNRKRRARGKLPLESHTILRLGAGMGIPQGGSRASSRAHLVRGHFKVRRGGVFWWNSHIRGDGKAQGRSAYEVRT